MPFEELAKLPLEGLSIVGVIFIVGWLVWSGRLVPKSIVNDLVSSREARITDLAAERDKWREAHEKVIEAFDARNDQHAELMELARTTDAFIRALPRGGSRR